ncbi:hypothetical protein Bca101_067142 [Brassica carinata]
MAESSEYPVRPGTKDCQFYLRTGRCGYGKTCRYNHPNEIPPEKINMPKCKYFLRGKCKYGSRCYFDHSKEGDGAEHTRQGQKRHRTESKSRSSPSPSPEKRENDLQKHTQEGIEKQKSTETEDNLQEEEKLRETKENDNDQQNQEEQTKRYIEKQRGEARLRLKQIKQTVHFDEAIRIRETLKELGFILTEGDGF